MKTAGEDTLIAENDQTEGRHQNEIIPALDRSFYISTHNVFSLSGGELISVLNFPLVFPFIIIIFCLSVFLCSVETYVYN